MPGTSCGGHTAGLICDRVKDEPPLYPLYGTLQVCREVRGAKRLTEAIPTSFLPGVVTHILDIDSDS